MINRIDKKFKELKKKKKKAFIAYITAGDPNLATTAKIVLALEQSGVDLVELGIPFSDPIADGPTIQAASQRALKRGATLKKIFASVKSLRRKTEIPLVFMTYYNPVLKFGLVKFFKACRDTGIDGVIVPDMPIEEAQDVIKLGGKSGVAVIFLVAPTSSKDRAREIAAKAKGFIYYVSLTGVTGARRDLPPEILPSVRMIKAVTDKPVAVGFGISDAKQARMIAKTADGVIIGSAIVRIIGERRNIIPRVSKFTCKIAKAIHDE